MSRIWKHLVLLPVIYIICSSENVKGSYYDHSGNSQLFNSIFGLSESKPYQPERQKRSEPQEPYQYQYYKIENYSSEVEALRLWEDWEKIPPNSEIFSNGYRRGKSVELPFDFPFFGQSTGNIIVTTGGFIYTGDYVHSWLAATQYIAPLMANFSLEDPNSHLYVVKNETSYTIIWRNMILKSVSIDFSFSFSATLHKTGEIVFVYFNVPIGVNFISDRDHAVKVGLSDAYLKKTLHFLYRRKTIYEYIRISIEKNLIQNCTIVRFIPLPTCQSFKDCDSCLNHDIRKNCTWCPAVNRCSLRNGVDRGYQQWQNNECQKNAIEQGGRCPVPEGISSTLQPESTTLLSYETTQSDTTTLQSADLNTIFPESTTLQSDMTTHPAKTTQQSVVPSTVFPNSPTLQSDETTQPDMTT